MLAAPKPLPAPVNALMGFPAVGEPNEPNELLPNELGPKDAGEAKAPPSELLDMAMGDMPDMAPIGFEKDIPGYPP